MKIKFTHTYSKLLDSEDLPIKYATLLDVIPVNLKDLSTDFLDYDTDGGKYTLPKSGDFLMLIFLKPIDQGNGGLDIFTTLRSNFPKRKEIYYKEAIGKHFEVEITEGVTP